MFKQITIIGLGLIGSSVAHAVRKKGLAQRIIAADVSKDVCRKVLDMGIADSATSDIRKSVVGSDFIVLCVPAGVFEKIGEEIGPSLKPGAIITDVCSVKGAVIQAMKPHIPESVHFVPAHPIAGTENSGPEAGFAELFEGRWCILTPGPDTDIGAVEKVTKFWESCGCHMEFMDAERHDLVLAITSHLPHLIAYTIVGTAAELEDDIKSEVIQYSASGFRGFTRIAASDPVVWRDVFLNNREAVLEILQRFTEDLTAMQKAIRRGDGKYLQEVFTKGRSIRRSITALGTEGYPSPPKEEQL